MVPVVGSWKDGVGAAILLGGALALACATAPGQSWVRQWGNYYYDTAAREMPIVRIGAKGENTAIVRRDGRVRVQGFDGQGMCRVPDRQDFVDVEVSPFGYCLARTFYGDVVAWGAIPCAMFPPPLPPGVRYTAMTGGYYHVVLLRSDGVALACGSDNAWGQLNIPVLPANTTLTKVDANRNYTVGLLSNGTLVAWGWNLQGECNVPTAPPGTTYVDVSAGYEHAMARRSDGMIDVWGNNMGSVQSVPPLPAGTSYLHCAAGWGWCVAWRSDGVFVEWGLSPTAVLGSLPLPVAPPGATCVQLQAGNFHGVALWSDHTCSGWGYNFFFECEAPKSSQPGLASPDRFVDLAVGTSYALYLRADGSVEGCGDMRAGQCTAPPLPVGVRYTRVFSRLGHSLALRSDGQLVGFGYNQYGQSTVPPLPLGVTYVDAAVSSGHSVAVRSDGIAVAFGYNAWGQCSLPPLPPGVQYVQADANHTQTLLLRSDGWIAHAGATHAGITR